MKSLDQLVNAPKVDRNPFNPAADRKSVNGYDHIMESLRTAALKRDAALAGTSATGESATATADTAATPATTGANTTTSATASPAYKPLTANEFGEAYVRNAIAAYARNSSLTPAATTPAPPTPEPTPTTPEPTPAPTTPAPTNPSGSGLGGVLGGLFGHH